MISEPNDVVGVNVYVSLCVGICMRLYSAVSQVVRDIALHKCTLLLLLLLLTGSNSFDKWHKKTGKKLLPINNIYY